MNDLILYAMFLIMGLALVYVINKVRQPIEIDESERGTIKRHSNDLVSGIGEIGDVLQELKGEISKGLKLKPEQVTRLELYVNSIDKLTKSKLLRWALHQVGV